MDMTSDCTKCLHCDVCKFKDEYIKIIGKLNYNVTLDWINTSYLCKHYRESVVASPNYPIINDSNDQALLRGFQWPSCQNCEWYKEYILGHKTYAGDSPCQRCSNYT